MSRCDGFFALWVQAWQRVQMIRAASMRRLTLPLLGLAAASVLAACSSSQPPPSAPKPVAGLVTEVLNTSVWPLERDWDGSVEAIDRATLAAQTGGRVADLLVDVGDVVDEGQVLVRFTAIEQQSGQRQAQAGLQAARAQADDAAATFQRVQEIRARKLVSQAELDRAQAANDGAQAQLSAARAALKSADQQVGYTAIRAPYRGVVTARLVEPGETVSPGQPLLSGLSLDQLRLVVSVPQRAAAQIDPAKPAFVIGEDGQRRLATRVTVFPQADAPAHSVQVRLDLPEGTSGLMPGSSAKAVFSFGDVEVLAIPRSALIKRGEVQTVAVIHDDGLIGLRQVRTGRHMDDAVEILAGLSAGETIAVDAAAALEARRIQRAAMAER